MSSIENAIQFLVNSRREKYICPIRRSEHVYRFDHSGRKLMVVCKRMTFQMTYQSHFRFNSDGTKGKDNNIKLCHSS